MKKLFQTALSLALVAGFAAVAPAAELTPVAKASAKIIVHGIPSPPGEDGPAAPAGGGAPALPGPQFRPKIKIKINQVINQKGNNPFNPVQPVYNYNGRTYDDAAELAQATGTGSGGTSGSAVGSNTRTSTPGTGVIFFFNPDTNQYMLGDTGTAPPAGFQEAFDNWTAGAGSAIAVQTNPASDFRITTPPAGGIANGVNRWLVSSGTHTMAIRETATGRQWRVNFTNNRDAARCITLTIHSVTRI